MYVKENVITAYNNKKIVIMNVHNLIAEYYMFGQWNKYFNK